MLLYQLSVAQYDLSSSPAVPPRIRCRTVLLFLHSVASPCDRSTYGGEERFLLSCGWLQNQLFGDLDILDFDDFESANELANVGYDAMA